MHYFSLCPAIPLALLLSQFCGSDLSSVDKTNKHWLPWQRPLKNKKNNFIFIIYSNSSTNPANLAKIGPANGEIIGLTELVKNEHKNNKRGQNVSPPLAAAPAGWANKFLQNW